MFGVRRFLLRLVSFVRARRGDADVTREINAHLQLLEDDFIARGMGAEEARFAARRAFGGQVEQTKLRQRDARSFRWLDDSWLDFKLAARMLAKYPGLSIIGGIGMAVSIAIGAAFFAFFHSYLYATLPIDRGERVVALENWNVTRNNEDRRSLHDFDHWRRDLKSIEDLSAYRTVARNLIVPGGTAEPVRIAEITASAFRIARVPPLLGRPLLEDDERRDAESVVVIGHDVWRSRFGGDPSVVGRQVRLGNTVHTIVGVMPEGFAFPVSHSYWTPFRFKPSDYPRGEGPAIFMFGRLADGLAMEDAQAEVSTLGTRAAAAFPATHAQLRPQVLPYAYPVLDIQDTSVAQVAMMQAIVSLLLVVVAVNVAILIYARTATRQSEIAVRTALGASRRRIVLQLFIEALVLSGLAAGAGLAIARFGITIAHGIIQAEMGALPYFIDYGLSPAAVLYAVGLAVLAAVIAGVVPALQATGRRVQSTLRALGGGTGLRLGTTWSLLIVSQVALAVAGLPMAAAFGWDAVREATTKPIFAAEQYLAVRMALEPEPPEGIDAATYKRELASRSTTLQRDVVAAVESEATVSDVTISYVPPGQESTARIEVQGEAVASPSVAPLVRFNRIAVDFFDAFDTPVLTGRAFTAADQAAAATAVIVNRTFVQKILGGGNALGRRVRFTAPEDANPADVETTRWYEIVGVVADLHANAMDDSMTESALYQPMLAGTGAPVSLMVQLRGVSPASFIGRLRELTTAIDPSMRISALPMVDIYRQRDLAVRLVGLAVSLVVISVLLLSAAGIYALMSFTVAQRRKEIGIRAALGADAGRLLRTIFSRAAAQLGAGVAIGLITVAALDMMSDGELLGPGRTVLLTIMSLLMIGVGLIAAIGPARRGLRIQPTQALREN